MKTILSLFDFSGNWSSPYEENGWFVIRFDLKYFMDIMVLNTDYIYEYFFDNAPNGTIDAILAAPPCTDFASSGAQYWPEKDRDGRTAYSLELVRQVLRVVDLCEPDFWALENPVGRLPKLLPEIGKPKYFQPFWYGDPYTKKTGLWGNFQMPGPTKMVEPIRYCGQGSWTQKLGGKSEKTKELRSITPMGFAQAFFEKNH